ncbi:hypothetical protein HPP92_005020 [Vanilla planifolia]|uniref:Fungal lipase-type domain-containing protein n=1 Tax=Vanilla planifolia TaxID=51239 RepID=A0A835RH05_VANPL|nr:hypothetical protein HPP92_005359 [Vanilla planifolia]KAG0494026.1 hypothetical protein HPP92_005020 [Vanilla planifolia]
MRASYFGGSSIRTSIYAAAPRHLPHHISSTSAVPATVRLGKLWPQFQGAHNWDGLLDPLDDTLRSEILRYGSFVEAAYSSCDLDPSSPSYATCRFPKHSILRLSGYPSTGYRVTRNLHATSGFRLPNWVTSAAPAWISRRSSWIGFVAVCQDDTEIARLGRRDIVVALRGTATCLEWLDNLRAELTTAVSFPTVPGTAWSPEPMVERGFWNLFTSPGDVYPSLRDQIRCEVCRVLDQYCCSKETISLTITGHSLGAALAVLAADDVSALLGRDGPMVTVVSFGGPRVGNASFRRRMEEQGSRVLRIVNTNDIVTKMPGFVENPREVDEHGATPSSLLSKTGWVYADIGRELRVSGRRTANVAACHDLGHYLQLVNQMSDTCSLASKENPQQSAWMSPAILAGDVL